MKFDPMTQALFKYYVVSITERTTKATCNQSFRIVSALQVIIMKAHDVTAQ